MTTTSIVFLLLVGLVILVILVLMVTAIFSGNGSMGKRKDVNKYVMILMVFWFSGCGVFTPQSSTPVFGTIGRVDTVVVRLTDTLEYMDTQYIDTTICPAGLVRDSMIFDTIRIKGKTEYRTRIVKVPVVARDSVFIPGKTVVLGDGKRGFIDYLLLILLLLSLGFSLYKFFK